MSEALFVPGDGLPEPQYYLGARYVFEPFEVRAQMVLAPGLVVRLTHEPSGRVTVFECTGMGGYEKTTGLLSRFRDGEPLEVRSRIGLNTIPANPNMAGRGMRILEFEQRQDKAQKQPGRRYVPAFTAAEQHFSHDLARAVHAHAKARDELVPFQTPDARSILSLAASLLIGRANDAQSPRDRDDLTRAAELLTSEIIAHL